MKNFIYLAIVAIMIMISNNASAQWTDIFNSNGGGSGKAELSTNKAATIKWEALEKNLGDVQRRRLWQGGTLHQQGGYHQMGSLGEKSRRR